MGGEVSGNLQKIFCYGIRNSFGMAFDPLPGNFWFQVRGSFDELNRAEPGTNGGWIRIMGPLGRLARQIETTALHHEGFPNLQELRWPLNAVKRLQAFAEPSRGLSQTPQARAPAHKSDRILAGRRLQDVSF
jgi:hypothetical protein